MTKYYLKNTAEKVFTEIENPRKSCWINLSHASSDKLEHIADLLNVDFDEITDSLDFMEIPRVEKINSTTTIIFARFPNMEETGVYTSPLTIIISEDHFVTICPTKCSLIDQILSGISNRSPADKTDFLVHILLRIIQSYTRVIKKIRSEVVIHEKDLAKVDDKDITELTQREENLNQCLNALEPLQSVIEDLLTGRFTHLEEEDQDHLEDLLLSSEQTEALCGLSLRIISSLKNSVQVVITNEFNKTIKLLTALTIILNLPTTIASIYGMNVSLPFEKSDSAFAIIMSFIIFSFIGSLYFFKRKRWL